jgi:hypothetical protein
MALWFLFSIPTQTPGMVIPFSSFTVPCNQAACAGIHPSNIKNVRIRILMGMPQK